MPRSLHWILISFRFGRSYRFRLTGSMCLIPLLVIGMPLGYALSIGPETRFLYATGLHSNSYVQRWHYLFYWPLHMSMESNESLDAFVSSYQHFWLEIQVEVQQAAPE